MPELLPHRAHYVAPLVVALFMPACARTVAWNQDPPAAGSSAAPEPTTVMTAAPSATRWPVIERSTRIEERQGQPVSMRPGARCAEYRQLPGLSYNVSTLVQDACLDIPSGTTVEVRDGATLVILATNGLRLGSNVSLDAKGAGGRRGARSPFASIRRDVETEAEIKAICSERGNQCLCPLNTIDSLQGRPGQAGMPGGSIEVVAAELLSAGKVAGFTSDVSGGVGGPPGDSGTQECARGELRCSSPACSAGAEFGVAGPPGRLVVIIGGSAGPASLAWIGAHALPAGALIKGALNRSLVEYAAELDNEAVQKGWRRRAGRSP